ncbi:MAG TPA: hypothetical protein VME66_03645 [Candidatus Acidoferrales bacterium]|nr:hypothetical protein [Candidatus Acidoferrales bacterium]
MSKRRLERGDALPETALTISVVLLVFLGLIKLAFVGYEQAQADGAAFVAAHAAALVSPQASAGPYGATRAHNDFGIPISNVQATPIPNSAGALNDKGDIVAMTNLTAGGLFPSQGFGVLSTGYNLHSFIVEPVAVAPSVVPLWPNTGPVTNANGTNSVMPANCLPNAPATDGTTLAMGSGVCTEGMYLATPSATAPYLDGFECRLAYMAVLDPKSGSAPTLAEVENDYTSTDGLSFPNGSSQEPWPDDYRYSSKDSILDPTDVNSGHWLTSNNESGNAVAPVLALGQPSSGYCS